ncbi:MAG: AAA family ATPase [Gaiellaceae bacterium]
MIAEHHTPSEDAGAENQPARLVMTGSCVGLKEFRDVIAAHPELELRGWCEDVDEAAGLLARGPAAVLHATDGAVPEEAIAAIRGHTDAPIVLVTPADNVQLRDANDHVVLLIPQEAHRVVAVVEGLRGGERADAQPAAANGVFTVFSPKGGTGKSVIATNLAVALAADGVSTLLVDLGLELGDDALMLGTDPRRTIFDLVAAPGALDTEKLKGYATRHASGLDVLPAPLRPEQAELVTEEKLGRILDVARDAYAAVVLDTPASFQGSVLTAIDRTDALLVVCELDMTTLKNVRVTLETLQLLQFPAERVSLVLNQPSPTRAMKRSELEAALGRRVRFELPYDDGVPASVGLGKPIVLSHSGGFARAVEKMAGELVPKRSKRGWSVTAEPQSGNSQGKRRWALRKA